MTRSAPENLVHSDLPTPRVPSYRLHKPSGQAVVRINGKDFYLGIHGTDGSRRAYDRLLAEWFAGHRHTPSPTRKAAAQELAVCELVLAYLRFAQTYYVKNGRVTGEYANMRDAARPMVRLFGDVPVHAFGPVSLKAVRQAMVDEGLSRRVVNGRVNRIRRIFRWGVEDQLVDPLTLQALEAVGSLKKGRCSARELPPVQPVDLAVVQATKQQVCPQIAAMIDLQLITGMRPGEVVLMRTRDVDLTTDHWTYTPESHKTEHHGRRRVIFLGPRAQEVLGPWLRTRQEAYLFSPQEVMATVRARIRKHAGKKAPRRKRSSGPPREPREHYTTSSYARAIQRGCDRAFPVPEDQLERLNEQQQADAVRRWRDQHRWSPNQLRHNAATLLRKQFGIEAARVILGHSSATTTEVYAERDLGKAAEVMRDVG
ncbi:site-specific integrase [Mucisphaera calidilacus]|uniref:Site-specific tyrosine recombinase XerC n=1 Tax=Mucisphaera calidilacus TaxID=2527982 RepID=A0A518BU06_9BACT|nr:site-specific integrase [Mucisphaera calidilacus]QDU70449.1 site-specific tyrosine recombinase XerC [Mucisphaera calidilacus]